MNDWAIILVTALALWGLWLLLGLTADLLQIYFDHYRAARYKREDMPTTKETERSS